MGDDLRDDDENDDVEQEEADELALRLFAPPKLRDEPAAAAGWM